MKLLMISFHFPPISQSSGYLRALKLAKYLPSLNIEPTILTVKSNVYDAINLNNLALLNELSKDTKIYRTTAFNASKHFAWKGKYLSWFAIPDLWSSWLPFGVIKGLKLENKNNFDAIWITYPISTALFIGYFLSLLIKKPLYVDLRDPVWEEETWEGTVKQKLIRWIEKKIVFKAAAVIFTSQGTIEKYKRRYGKFIHRKFHLIENGFDEDDFCNLPTTTKPSKKLFLHSGLLPYYERDPSCFFQAVAQLKEENNLTSKEVFFRFRATGYNLLYKRLIDKLNISDLIELCERKDYQFALSEMFSADVLMVFQHRTCNWQIPAKLYEYLRVGKPLLLLTGNDSDTLNETKKSGIAYKKAEIDDINEIKAAILQLLTKTHPKFSRINLEKYSRQQGAKKLANILRKIG